MYCYYYAVVKNIFFYRGDVVITNLDYYYRTIRNVFIKK